MIEVKQTGWKSTTLIYSLLDSTKNLLHQRNLNICKASIFHALWVQTRNLESVKKSSKLFKMFQQFCFCLVGTSPPTIEEFSNNENKVNKNNNTGSKVREVRVGQLRNLTCVVRQSYPQADIEWTDERGNSLHEIPTIYFHTQTLNSCK